ncbi:MAG: hypothetical protein IKS85_03930 [Lachnospiraceae bacterium]|nr:hypothetical protein [Lachnospiraceae bacterium]
MDTFMDQLAEKRNAQEMIKANNAAELEELEQVRDRMAGQMEDIRDYGEQIKGLEEKLDGMNEAIKDGYHKECVKVYRNVQAAFTEENEKQTSLLKEAMAVQDRKLTLALVLSTLAFLAAAGCLALQIMTMVR